MKFFCSLLAIVLLVLSCIPCSDAGGMAMEQNQSYTAAKGNAAHAASVPEEHEDLCSPFCQCACCALAYALPVILVPEVVARAGAADRLFALYLQRQPAGVALPIWQPPQLV